MNSVYGKALLVITKTDSRWNPFEVTVFPQSCSDKTGCWDVAEEFSLMETENTYVPRRAYKLKVGETLRISVTYHIYGWRDDWNGEFDSELEIIKERVLRVQKAPKHYINKEDQRILELFNDPALPHD